MALAEVMMRPAAAPKPGEARRAGSRGMALPGGRESLEDLLIERAIPGPQLAQPIRDLPGAGQAQIHRFAARIRFQPAGEFRPFLGRGHGIEPDQPPGCFEFDLNGIGSRAQAHQL